MTKEVHIREIAKEDYKSITELTNQLGANVLSDTVSDQIAEIIKNPDHFAFVAIKNERIVGYIHCFKAIRLTSKPFMEICGLIVADEERRNGIGKLLLQKVENLDNDSGKVRVRCNAKRESAHSFYDNLNFSLSKEQKIFEKKITLRMNY
jgi:N-acetylglutamate synthase-like GNAT family acetyltransferase